MNRKCLTYILIAAIFSSKAFGNSDQERLLKKIENIEKNLSIPPEEKISQLIEIKKEGQSRQALRVELSAASAMTHIFINLRRLNEAKTIVEDYAPIARDLGLKKEQYYFLRAELNLSKIDRNEVQSEMIVKKIKALIDDMGDQELNASANLDIAQVYSYYGKFRDSLRFAYDALHSFEKMKNKRGIAVSLNTIGSAYIDLREYKNAIVEFGLASNIAHEMKDQLFENIFQSNIGTCYFSLGDYKKALVYFLKSYESSRKMNDESGMAYSGKYLAAIYLEMNNLKSALQYSRNAYEIHEKLGDKDSQLEVAIHLYSVYSKLNMDKEASEIASKIEESAVGRLRTSLKSEYYKARYNHQKKIGNFKSALHFVELYIEQIIERSKQQRDEVVQEMIVKFEADRKEVENKLLQQENAIAANQILQKEKETTRLIFLLMLSLVVFLVIIILIRVSVRKTRFLHIERLNSEVRSRSLQEQMQPHFLFNCLNAISGLVYESSDKASDAIHKLADLYRLILKSTSSYTWRLTEEIGLIQDYLELQVIRYQDKIAYSIEYENVDIEKVAFPCLMLHTIVENSFKHALSLNVAGGFIKVRISESSGGYLVTVEDSGSGELGTKVVAGTGTGLENTRKRLLNMYGSKSNFFSKFDSKGSIVSFWVSGENIQSLSTD